MSEKKIAAFDIETIARIDLSDEAINSFCKVGNLKDPTKIQAKQNEAKSKLGANPLAAMPCCGGWYENDDNCGYISLKNTSVEAERDFLVEYWNKLAEFDVLVGFNSTSFDSRILLLRSAVHQIDIPFRFDRKRYSTTGNHLDLYSILTDYAPFGQGKLSFFLEMFGLQPKTEGMDGSLVQSYFDEELHDEIGEYCLQDCKATMMLARKIEGYFL